MNNFLEQYFGLSNKTAIVIGASRGIGKVLAEGLADAGANVYGFGRSSIEDLELNKKFKYQIKTGGEKLVKKFFSSI